MDAGDAPASPTTSGKETPTPAPGAEDPEETLGTRGLPGRIVSAGAAVVFVVVGGAPADSGPSGPPARAVADIVLSSREESFTGSVS